MCHHLRKIDKSVFFELGEDKILRSTAGQNILAPCDIIPNFEHMTNSLRKRLVSTLVFYLTIIFRLHVIQYATFFLRHSEYASTDKQNL